MQRTQESINQWKNNLSIARIGHVATEIELEASKKFHADPNWKQKQSDARKLLWQDPEYRKKCIANMKIAISNPEVKQKQSNGIKAAHEDPESKQRYSNGYIKRSQNPDWIKNHAAANLARHDALKGDKSHLWRGGKSFEPYCVKFNRRFKYRVRERFNNRCVECGTTVSYKLHVHHVNYNKETCCNDDIPLFVTLCRGCHVKTHFDLEYWEIHFKEILALQYGNKCYYSELEMQEIEKLNDYKNFIPT
jgi:hypothetical protein